ncbi:UNVERIFIED_CONTAM: RNA polymerase sigma factor [Microbacterium sp. SLM126]
MSDGELVLLLRRDDGGAFRQLFLRHERSLHRVAFAMIHGSPEAEEVVSAAFLELWRKRHQVRLVDDSILPWLLNVVSYHAKNHRRTRVRYSRLIARLPSVDHEPDHADEVARIIDSVPMAAAVREALRDLSPREASVFALCVIEELSTRDAAMTLGIPEGTVKSRLSRVKARLRARLDEFRPHSAQ